MEDCRLSIWVWRLVAITSDFWLFSFLERERLWSEPGCCMVPLVMVSAMVLSLSRVSWMLWKLLKGISTLLKS